MDTLCPQSDALVSSLRDLGHCVRGDHPPPPVAPTRWWTPTEPQATAGRSFWRPITLRLYLPPQEVVTPREVVVGVVLGWSCTAELVLNLHLCIVSSMNYSIMKISLLRFLSFYWWLRLVLGPRIYVLNTSIQKWLKLFLFFLFCCTFPGYLFAQY